jgi:hypothetical protein
MLIIDKEFRDFLPDLEPAEWAELQASIEQDGILSPVIVWAGKNILVDGHNRHDIGIDLGIEIPEVHKQFPDRNAVIAWMASNQLARRNLNPTQISYFRGKEYLAQKGERGGDKTAGDTPMSPKSQNATLPPPDTATEVAEKHGVNRATIHRDAKFAAAVDAAPKKERAAILAGKSPKSKGQIVAENPVCGKCQRVGKVKDCVQCEALKEAAKAKKKAKPKKKSPKDESLANVSETIPAPAVGKLETYYRNDGIPDLPGVYRPRMMKTAAGQEVVIDGYGNPAPAGVGDTFADATLRDILAQALAGVDIIDGVYKAFLELKAGRKPFHNFPWLDIPTIQKLTETVRNAAIEIGNELRAGIPYAVCPACSGERTGCKECRLSGYWPKSECEVYPNRFRGAA